jgi:hypothetical protein
LTLGDADPTIASLEDIYLDGTLVLVAFGTRGDDPQRDPSDPVDLHEAVVGPDEQVRNHGPEGPAWRADGLFTSAAFDAAREFARTVTAWASNRDGSPWAVLSPEHRVSMPYDPVTPFETTMDDIGADPRNEDHWADSHFRRRPDGQELVTDRDHWAAMAATELARWLAGYRDLADADDVVSARPLPDESEAEAETPRGFRDVRPHGHSDADTLLVVGDPELVDPLRERGVFEFGIGRLTGDPNAGVTLPVETRFLFDEIDADSRDEQIAWLSDALDRLDAPADEGDQHALGDWSGDTRACETCDGRPPEVELDAYDGTLFCPDHAPDRCSRCGCWTFETGLGSYALCEDCQTDRGGRKRTPVETDPTEQAELADATDVATDGGKDDGE